MASILLANLWLLAIAQTVMWLLSLWRRNAAVADVFWPLGFIGVAWFTQMLTENHFRSILLLVLVTIWAGRLALHLGLRMRGKGEDFRYRAMRDKHGRRFGLVSFFTVFLLQGGILWVVSLPLQAGIHIQGQWQVPMYIGIVVWGVGFAFESIGDWQLSRFRRIASNRGKVLDTGLWRLTRHPNYFGDCLVWWGLFLVACSPGTWWTVVAPIIMTVLLVRVSGVTLLESALTSRIDGYREYVDRTSAFWPRTPRP